MRQLYYGDNLDVLRRFVGDDSVDLCYIDPPFNSQRTYNLIYNNQGNDDKAQVDAFSDTWDWNENARVGFEEIVTNYERRFHPKLTDLITGLEIVLGKGSLLSYIVHLAQRITEIHRTLKLSGSLFLHCDPTASHYIKIVLDAVFVSQGGDYINEIVWRRTGTHNNSRSFGRVHDVIFFYVKSATLSNDRNLKYKFFPVFRPYARKHVADHFEEVEGKWVASYYGNVMTGAGISDGDSGKEWRGMDPSKKNRHWAVSKRLYSDLDESFGKLGVLEKLEALYNMGRVKIDPGSAWPIPIIPVNPGEGVPANDIWAFQPYTEGTVFGTNEGIDSDVRWLTPQDGERLGYPTQKPEGLLNRIIRSCTSPGDVVLDAYCGCGTTVAVSEQLGRHWIGIDITYQSIALILARFNSINPVLPSLINLHGIPRDFAAAEALANKPDDKTRKEFEKWAVLTFTDSKAIINEKKGADFGSDGIVVFKDIDRPGGEESFRKAIFSVKSNKVINPAMIASLRGEVQKHKAEFGVFISFYEPTKRCYQDASSGTIYHNKLYDRKFSDIQIVTIQEILDGARFPIELGSVVSGSKKLSSKAVKQRSTSQTKLLE